MENYASRFTWDFVSEVNYKVTSRKLTRKEKRKKENHKCIVLSLEWRGRIEKSREQIATAECHKGRDTFSPSVVPELQTEMAISSLFKPQHSLLSSLSGFSCRWGGTGNPITLASTHRFSVLARPPSPPHLSLLSAPSSFDLSNDPRRRSIY